MSTDSPVRRAGVGDVPELIRLRHAMFREMAAAGAAGRPDVVDDASWYPAAEHVLDRLLTTGDAAAFVIDAASGGTVTACAVVTAAVQWLDGVGAEITDIHATPAAEHLYRSLGFARARSTPLRRPRP